MTSPPFKRRRGRPPGTVPAGSRVPEIESALASAAAQGRQVTDREIADQVGVTTSHVATIRRRLQGRRERPARRQQVTVYVPQEHVDRARRAGETVPARVGRALEILAEREDNAC